MEPNWPTCKQHTVAAAQNQQVQTLPDRLGQCVSPSSKKKWTPRRGQPIRPLQRAS